MMKRIALGLSVGLVTLASLGGAYYLGYDKGLASPRTVEIRGIAHMEPGEELGADFSTFWEAWAALKEKYVSASEVSEQALVYGAIRGLAESTDDPYTTFFDPKEAKRFNEDVSGSFGGIGAELESREQNIIIVTPLKNTPAERVGLKPKDVILKVDDEELDGRDVSAAVKVIRGEPGTAVTLLIFREGFVEPKSFAITREIISVPALTSEVKEDGRILYLRIHTFNQNTERAFAGALRDALRKNPEIGGIVLDLRNNPGGYLDVAVSLAGWFLPSSSPVVIERFASGKEDKLLARGPSSLREVPLAVIVNGGSASAAEILAGALKDTLDTPIVGEKNLGKGTVKELYELSDGSQLKVKIAHWLTPKGREIDKNGILPDYVVKTSDEDEKAEIDRPLNRAIELVKKKMAASAR